MSLRSRGVPAVGWGDDHLPLPATNPPPRAIPAPEILAAEIVEDLEVALAEFAQIANSLSLPAGEQSEPKTEA